MSTENPYAALTTATTFAPDAGRDRRRKIATAQRETNLAVLFYFCLIPVNIAISSVANGAPWANIVSGVAALPVLVFGAVSVYSLASQFRGKFVAVLYVVGLLVPLLGLILLISINSKATSILRENGSFGL